MGFLALKKIQKDVSRQLLCGGFISVCIVLCAAMLLPQTVYAAVPACNNDAAQTIVSDTHTQVSGHDSVLVTFINTRWTAIITGAERWIWGEDPIADPVNQTSETLTRTFTLIGEPLGATLNIAADNTYDVSINGHAVRTDMEETNYFASGQDNGITIPASSLMSGANTITFVVTNLVLGTNPQDATYQTNPAGLLYTLSVHSNECAVPPTELKVHVFKYLKEGDAVTQVPDDAAFAPFPMVFTSTASNINGGTESSGSYVLGNNEGGASFKYAADTPILDAPASYTTSEVTDIDGSVLPIGATCVDGKFRLEGYKSGTSLPNAEGATISDTPPAYTDIDSDRYIIIVNTQCPAPVTLTNAETTSNGGGGGGGGRSSRRQIATTSDVSAGLAPLPLALSDFLPQVLGTSVTAPTSRGQIDPLAAATTSVEGNSARALFDISLTPGAASSDWLLFTLLFGLLGIGAFLAWWFWFVIFKRRKQEEPPHAVTDPQMLPPS